VETVEWNCTDRTLRANSLLALVAQWGYQIHHPLIGFNETMITTSSPSPRDAWRSAVNVLLRLGQQGTHARSTDKLVGSKDGNRYANGESYYGIRLDVGVGSGGPLFFTTTPSSAWIARCARSFYVILL